MSPFAIFLPPIHGKDISASFHCSLEKLVPRLIVVLL